mmetsp:Transcript_90439/g.235457  ORF Transcript_90439/g.235457 Transcript_90439/m.235457 type:complete len:252 (+) Transcript_90439:972-1727(+)
MASASTAAHRSARASSAIGSTPGSPGPQSSAQASTPLRQRCASFTAICASRWRPARESMAPRLTRALAASTARAGCACSRPSQEFNARSICLTAWPTWSFLRQLRANPVYRVMSAMIWPTVPLSKGPVCCGGGSWSGGPCCCAAPRSTSSCCSQISCSSISASPSGAPSSCATFFASASSCCIAPSSLRISSCTLLKLSEPSRKSRRTLSRRSAPSTQPANLQCTCSGDASTTRSTSSLQNGGSSHSRSFG